VRGSQENLIEEKEEGMKDNQTRARKTLLRQNSFRFSVGHQEKNTKKKKKQRIEQGEKDSYFLEKRENGVSRSKNLTRDRVLEKGKAGGSGSNRPPAAAKKAGGRRSAENPIGTEGLDSSVQTPNGSEGASGKAGQGRG